MKTTIFPSAFEHQVFGTLRVIITDEQKTMFNLTDVCRALDIKNPSDAKGRLAKRGVVTTETPTLNQFGATALQPMTYIDEANLYRCIFQSRKAEAQKFQDWVFEEVLPQIRQTGGYIPTRNAHTGEALTAEEIVDKAMGIMQKTISRENHPADGCFSTTEIAKLYGMDTKDFYSWLTDEGIVRRKGGRYYLTERYAGRGYDKERIHHSFSLDGRAKVKPYMVWTAAGEEFLHERMSGR